MPTTSAAAPRLAAGVPAVPANVESPAARLLRRGLLGLCAASIAGTAVELAMVRHWNSPIQMVPWFALGALTLALAAVVKRPTPTRLKWARAIAAGVALTAVFGVVEHVEANYHAGRRDPRYSSRWETMSTPARWWAAVSGGVRKNPVLAPAVLAEAAFCLALATARHPATGGVAPGATADELRGRVITSPWTWPYE
jgi:hypothetical protein